MKYNIKTMRWSLNIVICKAIDSVKQLDHLCGSFESPDNFSNFWIEKFKEKDNVSINFKFITSLSVLQYVAAHLFIDVL